MLTTMEFDIISFISGVALSSAVAWFIYWSERGSLANRIAYSCCEKARILLDSKRELVTKTLNLDIWAEGALNQIIENIYPIVSRQLLCPV